MWNSRISALASQPPEFLRLNKLGDGPPFHGRYLTVDQHPFAVGRFIASGDEALVHELVDLRTGLCSGVVKVCRFPPGTPRYTQWAVPQRAEINPYSHVPEVETVPARLVEVAGGLVKCQVYVTNDPATDWRMDYPAYPVYDELQEGRYDVALEVADDLIQRHGSRAILLEARGRVLERLERNDEAIDALRAAVEAHVREGNAGRLSASLPLARLLWNEYWSNPGHGDVQLTPIGVASSVTYFSSVEAAAEDDERQDRAVFVLLEALAEEPYFVGGLVLVMRMVVDEVVGEAASRAVLGMIESIDPTCPQLPELRDHYRERFIAESLDDYQLPANEELDPTTATVPDEIYAQLAMFNAKYQPEPEQGQQAAARFAAAIGRRQEGQLGLAERDLRAAVQLDPTIVYYRTELVSVLLELGLSDFAAIVAEATVAAFPSDYAAYAALGHVQGHQRRFADAKISYLRAIALDRSDPDLVRVRLGYVYRELDEHEQALSVLRTAYDAAPTNVDAVLALVYALRKPALENARPSADPGFREAVELLREATRHHPESAELVFAQWQLNMFAFRYQAALAAVRRLAELEPDHPMFAEGRRQELEEWLAAQPPDQG